MTPSTTGFGTAPAPRTPAATTTTSARPERAPGLSSDLAYRSKASQSSTAGDATASRAVDGRAGRDSDTSTTARTRTEAEPWWQSDLGRVRPIGGMSLWLPGGTDSAGLGTVHLLVSDVPFRGAGLDAARRGPGVSEVVLQSPAGEPVNVSVGRPGRYVRVQLEGTAALALAEVQVWASPLRNLALGRPAIQSSTGLDAVAARAVDGDRDGDFSHGSVTHTADVDQPWWQVDLGARRQIGTVSLWNRTDCCADRLTGVHLLVSDVPFAGPTLGEAQGTPGALDLRLDGTVGRPSHGSVGRPGRYVRVQVEGTGVVLSLAEVEVWSAEGPNLARGGAVSVSSSHEGDGWSAGTVTDGRTGPLGWSSEDSVGSDHTEWLRVDLGRPATLGSVVLYPQNAAVCPGFGFPVDFTVRVSVDGVRWYQVVAVEGARLSDSAAQSFVFPPVQARFVDVNATSLQANPVDSDYFRLQFAELEAYGPA